MTKPTNDRFRAAYAAIERRIEECYGIPVRVSDVPAPFTGDLDGAEIQVDYGEAMESALFIVAHLFGHTVQWNVCEEARRLGMMDLRSANQRDMEELYAYENEAGCYSMQLFHEAGVMDLDQWLSDFSACDLAYLEHFYRTGDNGDFMSFWKSDQRLLSPLSIPDFHPKAWVSRWRGVVV